MTVSTETTLQELKELIIGLDKKRELQILELDKKIEVQFTEVKGEIKRLDERINGLDKQLNERINNLDKQLNSRIDGIDKRQDSLEILVRDQGNRFWSLVVGAFLALFGLLAKMAFFPTSKF